MMGTPLYMPPEAMLGKFQYAGDVFSFGVLAFELLTGEYPFEDVPIRVVLTGSALRPRPQVLARVREMVPAIAELLARTLEQRPEQRPSVDELVAAFAR